MVTKVLDKIEGFVIKHRRIFEPLAFVLATTAALMMIAHQSVFAGLLLFIAFYLGWVLGK